MTMSIVAGPFAILWLVTLISDLRHRRVPTLVLLALTLMSLIGQTWPWWLMTSAMLLWPTRRGALLLASVALGIGMATSSPAPALAIAAGSVAWALGWWGGTDSIALTALSLRYGLAGLMLGATATMIVGLLVMLRRRRALVGLLSVLPDAIALQSRDAAEIPPEAEMPAAAALAIPGLLLSIGSLMGPWMP